MLLLTECVASIYVLDWGSTTLHWCFNYQFFCFFVLMHGFSWIEDFINNNLNDWFNISLRVPCYLIAFDVFSVVHCWSCWNGTAYIIAAVLQILPIFTHDTVLYFMQICQYMLCMLLHIGLTLAWIQAVPFWDGTYRYSLIVHSITQWNSCQLTTSQKLVPKIMMKWKHVLLPLNSHFSCDSYSHIHCTNYF